MPSYRPHSQATRPTSAIRRAAAWSNRRPAGLVITTSPSPPHRARTACTARYSGSAFITIPGPPPNGTSSTTRWRSVV